MMKNNILCWVIGVGCWLLSSCNSTPENVSKVDQLPNIYPDYIGVTIPVEMAPLNFDCPDADCVDVVVKGSKGASCMYRATMPTLI